MTTGMRGRLRDIEETLLPDEYRLATRLVVESQRLMSSPPALPSVPDDPFEVGEISEAWIAGSIDRQDGEARLARRRAVLLELASNARARATAAAASIRDEVLAGYHHELQRLLDDVRGVAAELGGADSADEAIKADRGAAWKRLGGLADDYHALRQAQLARTDADLVIRSRPSQGGEQHASDLFLRNLDFLWPEWKTGGANNGRVITTFGGGVEHRYEPWPASQPQLLLWLATSQAEPWIPTPAQLQRHWADRQKRSNPMAPQPATPEPTQYRVVKPLENITTGGF